MGPEILSHLVVEQHEQLFFDFGLVTFSIFEEQQDFLGRAMSSAEDDGDFDFVGPSPLQHDTFGLLLQHSFLVTPALLSMSSCLTFSEINFAAMMLFFGLSSCFNAIFFSSSSVISSAKIAIL